MRSEEMPGARAKRAWMEKSRPQKKKDSEERKQRDLMNAVNKAANKFKWGAGVKK